MLADLSRILCVCVHSSIIIGIFAIRFDSFDSSFHIDFRSLHLFHFQLSHTHKHNLWLTQTFANECSFNLSVCVLRSRFSFFYLDVCMYFCAFRISTSMNTLLWDILGGIIILFAAIKQRALPISRYDSFFLRFSHFPFFYSTLCVWVFLFFLFFGAPSFFTDTFDLQNDWFECECECECEYCVSLTAVTHITTIHSTI